MSCGILFQACQDSATTTTEKSIQEIPAAVAKKTSNADIIRNPVSANEPLDTVNVAKIEFEETEYDFGVAMEGAFVEHVYKFTNTGKVPLVISDARSTCGCTVPKWSKEPIAPGESGEMEVKFNTTRKLNNQKKPITITANTYPSQTKIWIKGYVKPSNNPALKGIDKKQKYNLNVN